MTLTDLPAPFAPSIPMMFVGIVLVPLACVAVFILTAARWGDAAPRPYGMIVFFAVAAAALVVSAGELWWKYSLQTLLAMVASVIGVGVEVAVRELHRHWIVVGGAALVSVGYYCFLVCAVASAGV